MEVVNFCSLEVGWCDETQEIVYMKKGREGEACSRHIQYRVWEKTMIKSRGLKSAIESLHVR